MRTGNRSISISGTQGSDHHARNTGARPSFFSQSATLDRSECTQAE